MTYPFVTSYTFVVCRSTGGQYGHWETVQGTFAVGTDRDYMEKHMKQQTGAAHCFLVK